MNATLTLDPSGNLLLPAELLADAHLAQGAEVEVDVTADRIVVKPVAAEQIAIEQPVRLVEKEGLLVFTGGPPREEGGIVRAIKADREERDARIARAGRGE